MSVALLGDTFGNGSPIVMGHKFARIRCATCAVETLHRFGRCIHCGTPAFAGPPPKQRRRRRARRVEIDAIPV